ncbi:MAG: hypothetical protein WB802_14210 [Candidatus Dormiibacterota bacterium]
MPARSGCTAVTVLSKLSRWAKNDPAWGTRRNPATVPATRTLPAERTKRLIRGMSVAQMVASSSGSGQRM